MKHVPNALTAVRIVVTPILIYLLFRETFAGYAWALGLFVVATVSDYLDGSLARRYRVGTRLGQFLDPFADKVLVIGTFVALTILMPERIPWWAVGLLALRGVGVTAIRSWMESGGHSLRTRQLAKLKTAAQLTFLIGVLVLQTIASGGPDLFGQSLAGLADRILAGGGVFWTLMLVVAVTLYTGFVYLSDARRHAAHTG